MKYIKQFSIILAITFISEILKSIITFPIPASIYGMVILFLALTLKVIKLEQVKETGKFLVEIMPIMFIPAGARLMESWTSLNGILIQVLIIAAATTFIVMAVTGRVTQFIIRKDGRRK